MIKKLLLLLLLLPSLSLAKEATTQTTEQTIKEVQEMIAPPQPIVVYTPMSFMDRDIDLWEQVSQQLLNYNGGNQTLKLVVSGVGGDLMVVDRVMDAIERAQAKGLKVEMEASGNVISGHALLMCAADTISMRPNTLVVYHYAGSFTDYFFGYFTVREVNKSLEAAVIMHNILSKCERKGLLTLEQIKAIEGGYKVSIVNIDGSVMAIVDADYYSGYLYYIQNLAYILFLYGLAVVTVGLFKRV